MYREMWMIRYYGCCGGIEMKYTIRHATTNSDHAQQSPAPGLPTQSSTPVERIAGLAASTHTTKLAAKSRRVYPCSFKYYPRTRVGVLH